MGVHVQNNTHNALGGDLIISNYLNLQTINHVNTRISNSNHNIVFIGPRVLHVWICSATNFRMTYIRITKPCNIV